MFYMRHFLFSDEKISFSVLQGLLASKCKVIFFKHNDTDDLETILKEYHDMEQRNVRNVQVCLFY